MGEAAGVHAGETVTSRQCRRATSSVALAVLVAPASFGGVLACGLIYGWPVGVLVPACVCAPSVFLLLVVLLDACLHPATSDESALHQLQRWCAREDGGESGQVLEATDPFPTHGAHVKRLHVAGRTVVVGPRSYPSTASHPGRRTSA